MPGYTRLCRFRTKWWRRAPGRALAWKCARVATVAMQGSAYWMRRNSASMRAEDKQRYGLEVQKNAPMVDPQHIDATTRSIATTKVAMLQGIRSKTGQYIASPSLQLPRKSRQGIFAVHPVRMHQRLIKNRLQGGRVWCWPRFSSCCCLLNMSEYWTNSLIVPLETNRNHYGYQIILFYEFFNKFLWSLSLLLWYSFSRIRLFGNFEVLRANFFTRNSTRDSFRNYCSECFSNSGIFFRDSFRNYCRDSFSYSSQDFLPKTFQEILPRFIQDIFLRFLQKFLTVFLQESCKNCS